MQIDLLPHGGDAKFAFDLFPSESELRHRAFGQAEVKLMMGKVNRILVQDIAVQQFSETIADDALKTVREKTSAQFSDRYGKIPIFRIVTTRLTCQPSDGCIFTHVRTSFGLGRQEDTVRPIACTLVPDSKANMVTVKDSVEISSELTVQVVKTGSKGTHGTEYQRSEYQIRALGGFSPEPAWDFYATHQEPEVAGDLTLVMVVVSPEGLKSDCTISVAADAKLEGLPGIPMITRRRSGDPTPVHFSI